MKVYRIYDYEEEYLFGEKQTIKFAKDLNIEYFEDCYYDEEDVLDYVLKVKEKENITIEEAIKVINYANYDIEELEVY